MAKNSLNIIINEFFLYPKQRLQNNRIFNIL